MERRGPKMLKRGSNGGKGRAPTFASGVGGAATSSVSKLESISSSQFCQSWSWASAEASTAASQPSESECSDAGSGGGGSRRVGGDGKTTRSVDDSVSVTDAVTIGTGGPNNSCLALASSSRSNPVRNKSSGEGGGVGG